MPIKTLPIWHAPEQTTILAVSASSDDLDRLRGTCEKSYWNVQTAQTLQKAKQWLLWNPTPVVLCQDALPDGGWRALLEFGTELPDPPNLVIFSRHADDYLWAEVLNLGAYDVISFPVDSKAFFRTVSSALRNWNDRSDHHAAQTPRVVLACTGPV